MQPSKNLLVDLFEKIKEKKIIEKELVQELLEEMYPGKSPMIFEVIERGIVKNIYKPSNRVIWTVIDKEKKTEYVIYPKLFCSCYNFYNNVVRKRKGNICKHLLAQLICEAQNNYKTVELEDNEFFNRINDLSLEF